MKFVRLTAAILAAAAVPAAAHMKTPTVGGAAMYPSKTIVENAATAPNLTTLVAAVKAAGLVDTLSGPGPFTVFAPTNDAFAKLPAGTVDTLLKPENKGQLTGVLTYHVVPGRLTAANIIAKIKAGKGHATLKTVAGGTLTARLSGGKVVLTDAQGGKSIVTQANVFQKNGVVHVIDSVLLP
ncbi:fasciclin domain-containing protein [Sphingomonas astaxanthinifaciens]|uniref:Fasciclin n=1 Tax=Sphingomonas astaxanthinifaciens DSM 22298 TaxID=1123267 RepID=A0ABQ5Z7I7_9SPHN|nr:fasciclin domain-containing protein [Sphingomonas astaxanthinifaciens]GLR48749.1 fasciclin [Sphingomonas astaxanthinifaciens DSM 22298]